MMPELHNCNPLATRAVVPSFLFIMEKQMNVYTPQFEALAAQGADVVSLHFGGVTQAGDPECGGQNFWLNKEFSLSSRAFVVPDTVMAGLRWAYRLRHRRTLVIVQGSRFAFCRGIVFGSALLRGPATVVRTDNTAEADSRGEVVRALKHLVLPAWYRLATTVAPASSMANDYVQAYGMSGLRRFFFPYVIPSHLFKAPQAKRQANRRAFRQSIGLADDVFVGLVVAKLNARETPWDVVKIAAASESHMHWVVVGDGDRRSEFEHQLRASGQPATFLGYQPYEKLPALYHSSDVFLHAPLREVWGVSINEALASGCPVIASDTVGAALDLVTPSVGRVYRHGDPAELTAALADVRIMAADRLALATRCEAKAEEISPAAVASGLRRVANELCSRAAPMEACV